MPRSLSTAAPDQQGTVTDKLMAITSKIKNRLLLSERQAEKEAARAAKEAEKKKSALQHRAVAAAQHPVGFALLATATAYLTVRGSIEAFHRTRRHFLRNLLVDVSTALQALGQTYWIELGCLLGIHRDGDLILHDNDIDLAVLNPDWPALLEGLKCHLPPNKYSLKVVTPEGKPESSWIRVYCPLGMADLIGAYTTKNAEGGAEDQTEGSKVYVDNGHGNTMFIARDLVLPPSSKPWRGTNLCVPRDVEGTLERRYGPEWRIPKYAAKGADTVESNKPYVKFFRLLARVGIRV